MPELHVHKSRVLPKSSKVVGSGVGGIMPSKSREGSLRAIGLSAKRLMRSAISVSRSIGSKGILVDLHFLFSSIASLVASTLHLNDMFITLTLESHACLLMSFDRS